MVREEGTYTTALAPGRDLGGGQAGEDEGKGDDRGLHCGYIQGLMSETRRLMRRKYVVML